MNEQVNHEVGRLCVGLTLLCLKWEPRMLLLNSPTLETTKEVPSSVHAIKCADFESLIILSCEEGQGRGEEKPGANVSKRGSTEEEENRKGGKSMGDVSTLDGSESG